ncbi:MAG: DUF349 domain-containing protein [Erysipelotrichaceae bacterium]|nr:DUF349 domain-containing protein [Erysipelotrichaceae bacterium]
MEEKSIITKEELLQKAKELVESEDLSNILSQVRNLKKQWRRTGSEDDESYYDKQLSDEFYGYIDKLTARESEIFASVEEKKNDIINKAKALLVNPNYKKATVQMNELFDEWKEAGRADKEKDDELWEQFREVRNQFFANKKAYFEGLSETFAQNQAAKEALIEKAKEANKLENFKEITGIMNDLMEQWKQTGSAGRDHDDELWSAFSAERKAFFKNRNAYYEGLRQTFAERAEKKREIIADAKKCLARSEFTEEEIEEVKGLRARWKEVGNAGRDHEDELWNEFNSILNKYFENLRFYKD